MYTYINIHYILHDYVMLHNFCNSGCKEFNVKEKKRKSIIGYTGQFEFGLLEDSGYVPLTEIITNKANLDTNKNYFYLKKSLPGFHFRICYITSYTEYHLFISFSM